MVTMAQAGVVCQGLAGTLLAAGLFSVVQYIPCS